MFDTSQQIERQIPRLRRYARALTGDTARADDLVQDTLERAWGRWHLWRRGSDLRAWLFAIMHNLFVNQVRDRRRPDTLSLDEHQMDWPQRAAQEDGLAVRDIAAALEQLPAEQREAVLLVGLEDLSYAQAAEVMGIPVGTLMSRLARGRERLRMMMEGGGAAALRVVK